MAVPSKAKAIINATSIKPHFERFSAASQGWGVGFKKDGSGVEPELLYLNLAAKLCHFSLVVTEGKQTFTANYSLVIKFDQRLVK